MEVGDRVIQIPMDWPSREGIVSEVGESSHQVCITWDDGRKGWYHESDLVREAIWLIKPDNVKVAPV